ncbi:hypothetical protein BKA66DRAFT_461429 [Pyrenochaeta sp. MPI-SDFR-AT-0127]|nr:hypothetical protein BKA66DRAFT_461429 [Pyrenochaeta sp. MPI-SDFR-AT-0127]
MPLRSKNRTVKYRPFLRPWVFCMYTMWPPAIKRRHKANTLAEAHETYNNNSSLIYQLPPELILDVTDHLQTVDIFSLQLTCRRYTCLLQSRSRYKVTSHDRALLWDRLERDRYYRLAQAEACDVRNLHSILCSFCRDSHDKAQFQVSEVYKSPHIRKCMGSTGLLRICKHLALSFSEVQERLTKDTNIRCMHWPFSGCTTLFMSQVKHKYRVFHIDDLFWNEFDSSMTLLRSTIQEILMKLAKPVCPHMRTDSPAFQQAILDSTCSRDLVETCCTRRPTTAEFAGPSTRAQMSISCPFKGCDTRVEIERWPNIGGGVVLAKIIRELGQMKSATDPKWCAQLEHPLPGNIGNEEEEFGEHN